MMDPPGFSPPTEHLSFDKFKTYAAAIPYSIEPNSKMQDLLDLIITRVTQTILAKDYEPGLVQWDSMLAYWLMLKYPLPKSKRIALAKVYFDLCITPGMPLSVVSTCADTLQVLTRSKKKLCVDDLRFDWRPIWEVLDKDLFLSRRQFEITQTSYYMGHLAEITRRFFHPACADEMLEEFVPRINGMNLNTILSTQYFMNTFLPLSHPFWLPMIMRLWQSVNSYMFDERHLALLSTLAEMHIDPTVSDPDRIEEIPLEGSGERPKVKWNKEDYYDNCYTDPTTGRWKGLFRDVGIFTQEEWDFIMCKCLASMQIPLADGGSLTTGPSVDEQATFEFSRLPKSQWRIFSLARLIVYSMAPDSKQLSQSGSATPFEMPLPPTFANGSAGGPDYFSIPLPKEKSYLAGCRALDSLARLIVSVENFFHPSTSGAWTADLSAFVKYVVLEFNKRWHEEEKEDCNVPMNRRLTPEIRRELVRCLRTVALLAMFSTDGTTVSNIQSALKSMTVMEPELILHPILERAIPSLEALVETQRTTAVIKALGAVALALVSRDVYYAGSKHLLNILELLLPGIDLNDPTKTMYTTAFLVEVSQHVKFGDLTLVEPSAVSEDNVKASWSPDIRKKGIVELPQVRFDLLPEPTDDYGQDTRLADEEEDALLRDSTSGFANWVTSFIRRVILLFENLPEENTSGGGGAGGGETEIAVVDSVTAACSQICVHLSEPLFDLVLNLIYDFATTTVRSNAVRAVHQLVECVSNANPVKTLARFVPFCISNIRQEIEHGASSLRTTSMTRMLPSDATLHWNLAILRGSICNDGRGILPYRDELMSLLKLLHEKTFSKRGFSWTGNLICSIVLTLTHTYPLENKFVNPDEWNSEEFRNNHHKYWGKLYSAKEVKVQWHTPSEEELEFAFGIFENLVDPTITTLKSLLDDNVTRDAVWRNDFCRHLSFVRHALAGTPTLCQEFMSDEEILKTNESSDIFNEIPEFIASVPSISSGFALTDPDSPRYKSFMAIRKRFGQFLHQASVSLLGQGDENTVDAVLMLIRSCRTYLFEYGDSRDNHSSQRDQYVEEISLSRRYAKQKEWPRALFVRRARLYHAARLHWNSLERTRGPLEDDIIDDMIQWSLWHYATVRAASQSLLEGMTYRYDGVRRRCFPQLYSNLVKGTEDDRMKGALYTINSSVFAKAAMGEPTLIKDFIKNMFDCQWNEKPSIQDCVSTMTENCMSSLVEPNYFVYSIDYAPTSASVSHLQKLLPQSLEDPKLVSKCEANRKKRHQLHSDAVVQTINNVLEVANDPATHWRYEIAAIRILRTLIRRDQPIAAPQLQYFLEQTAADHPSMRYYAQRAVMKSSRYLKLRTHTHSIKALALSHNQNPLRRMVTVEHKTHEYTAEYLESFRTPLDLHAGRIEPVLQDKTTSGWLAWKDLNLFLVPHATKSTFQPWEAASEDAVTAMREAVMTKEFWEDLTTHYSEENHQDTTSLDNVSTVKSAFQVLEDEPLALFKPFVEKLVADTDQNKQRAAAEFLAGVIGGSKHWPTDKQTNLWKWLTPLIPKALGGTVKTDTMEIWASFLEYVLGNKDPRRIQPLLDYLLHEGLTTDFNAESSFQATKVTCFMRIVSEELGWRFAAWSPELTERYWAEIGSEHDEVRAYIADALVVFVKIHWRPRLSVPVAEVFVRECRTRPSSDDIMGIESGWHMEPFLELVDRLPQLRETRLTGARAPKSPYDRTLTTVIKWLSQALYDVNASSTFQYILPLLPELFKAAELQDSDELSGRAQMLLVTMCGVTPPLSAVPKLLKTIFQTILKSTSWRIRLNTLPILQVFYFRNVPLIEDEMVIRIQDVLSECLNDEVVEVREMAATTLSGILRCSPRRSILILKERFTNQASSIVLPKRNAPSYPTRLRQLHAAILGVTALIDAFPYSVPHWLPELVGDVLSRHTYDPIPISSSVRKCATKFKETHSDTWHEDSLKFDEEQMSALTTLLAGSSYYA